uniref:F-box domain-containing protein n=1 Tax=Trichogramma kaykai TaxID=54128 RepID=A0ABD2VY28_9HYME
MIIRLLLKHGADQNPTNEDGATLLHFICQKCPYDYPTILTLFQSVDELQLTVQIDAQDKRGDTSLLLALKNGKDIRTVQRGANPSLANEKGLTPLHIICQSDLNAYSLRLFFEFNEEIEKTVQIDARDNEGNTPLHLAISCGNLEMIELLLRRSTDPCLANAKGLTPLLLIARREVHDDMMSVFLSINEKRQQTVGIDARDDSGRTALEWAVTRYFPLAVKILLRRGADLSGFVFPVPSDSDRYWDNNRQGNNNLDKGRSVTKLTAATGLLATVELLETRGYKLDRDDALKFMGFFDKYGLYESTDFSTSKEVDDLVDSLFKQMAKKPTYMDYFKFASSYKLRKILHECREACSLLLCEKVSTKFFRDWALDPFKELMHYRLPTECCEIVFKKLKNKDLFNICLAAAGRSSRQ